MHITYDIANALFLSAWPP